ncbi:MAG: N-acetylmuramoyl-L-alanine amidase [Candidatus Peribacteria bacterium]|nr:N-acetylmuramoyl-L-alanine amidase [Candidatus Peribacteria bacterium]
MNIQVCWRVIPSLFLFMRYFLLTAGAFVLMPAAAFASFSDISSDHHNYDAVNYVQEQGIVSGYSDGTFRPNQFINRAEFAKIVVGANFTPKALETCDPNFMVPFTDTPKTAWYIPYLCVAAQSKIIGGYPNGTFQPDSKINFAESAKILAILTYFRNGDQTAEVPAADPNDPWYARYIRILDQHKAIPISITRFDPFITRGEMAEMVYRLKAKVTNKPSPTYDDLMGVAKPVAKTAVRQYINEQLGVSLNIPLAWPEPVVQMENVYSQGGEATDSPLWRIELGPKTPCKSGECQEYNWHIDGFKVKDEQQLLSKLQGNSIVKVLGSTIQHNQTHIVYVEGGMCGNKDAFILGPSSAVRLAWDCGGDSTDAEQKAIFNTIEGSLQLSTVARYKNAQWGYRIDYPSDWLVKENTTFVELDDGTKGTLIHAAGSDTPALFIAVAATCPKVMPAKGETQFALGILGMTFTGTTWSDGAAGTIYEGAKYVQMTSASPCVYIQTVMSFPGPGAFDNPKQVAAAQAADKAKLTKQFEATISSFQFTDK